VNLRLKKARKNAGARANVCNGPSTRATIDNSEGTMRTPYQTVSLSGRLARRPKGRGEWVIKEQEHEPPMRRG